MPEDGERKTSKESVGSAGSKGKRKTSKESAGSKGSKGSAGDATKLGSKGSGGDATKLGSKESGGDAVALVASSQNLSGAEVAATTTEGEEQTESESQSASKSQSQSQSMQIVRVDSEEEEDTHFRAEPLHVRYLCKMEHRRAVREIKDEEQQYSELKTQLLDPELSEDAKKEAEEECGKLEYRSKVRHKRFEKLSRLNPQTHEEFPALLIAAARDGDASFVMLAFEAKVHMDVQDEDLQVTPLIMATVSNKINVVKLLLELKANQRVQDVNQATCVHYAVQLDHVHVLAVLMDANPGKDWETLTMKDSRNMSPIDYARRPERSACMRLLNNRMGGPGNVAWQVFKGWLSDKTGCCRPHILKQPKKKGCCSCCSCSSCTKVSKAK